ncbi:MAG: sporulation protein YabP [Ruminococcaceae bacterium]|jgi:sporulation protein YabP|nr:sporulation protein YabP [Oscillospiraceae bacterium]
MNEDKKLLSVPNNIIMEDRRMLTVSGVSDVDSFDEETVVVYTDLGLLTIRGNSLHINRLSVETGELSVEGEINSLAYTDSQPKNASFFSKVFR